MVNQETSEISKKLDEITRLLEELLILQMLKAEVNLMGVRALVKVEKKRVNRMSGLIKKSR